MDISSERSYNTPASASPLLPLLLLSLARQRHAPHTTTCLKKTYDYIVVGGGSAGSVIASRLSEEPCNKVLLLEAGPLPPLLTEVPAYGIHFLGTDVDWQYISVPQKYSGGAQKNKQLPWSLGKMIGGCGNHNSLNYVRGNRKNYDDWAAQGAKGWSYKEVFPYFLKMEDFQVPQYLYNGYHATGGPMTVSQPNYVAQLKVGLTGAILEAGYQFVDSNGPRQTGFFDVQSNIRDNQRCSPVKAYLVPAENRTNLDIYVNSVVTKIIIEDKEARGVEFFHEGQFKVVKARREVILTAGAVNTPKIMMLSGVGPKEDLLKFNIPVVADLPVGKNFHDHPAVPYYFTLKAITDSLPRKLANFSYIEQYINDRSGPLASATGIYYSAFLNGLEVAPKEDFPNVWIAFTEIPRKFSKEGLMRTDVYEKFIEPYENDAIAACFSICPQPKSRGTVTLSSPNPFDPPLIDPSYFENPQDLEHVLLGIKVCQKILETIAIKTSGLGAKAFETKLPDCQLLPGDEYWRCYIRQLVATPSHCVGTCKMGNPNDASTVVDPQLRVKNIKRLRVADASVIPIVPSGNTNIPTIMVAEKASDIIKKTKPPKIKFN